MNKIRVALLLVILFTSYVAIQQHILGEQSLQPVVVTATEKPKAKKVKQEVELIGYPAPPTDAPIFPGPGYPAPETSEPLPTFFPTQAPRTPIPYETPDMSSWCELAPDAWFCAP